MRAEELRLARSRWTGDLRDRWKLTRRKGLTSEWPVIHHRVDGRWRQIHRHGSVDDPEMLARYLDAVRRGGEFTK